MESSEFTEMKVYRLVLDPNTNSPIVVLQEEATGVLLPIWIGIFEAHSIAMKMEGVQPNRPMTHDLLRNFFDVTKSLVERVEVVDLVDNTYFARIYFYLNQQTYAIDSRPSDAIALALRTVTPIYVANHVLEQSKIEPGDLDDGDIEEGSPEDENRWREILKNFNPGGTKIN